jgi:hypothetical protein
MSSAARPIRRKNCSSRHYFGEIRLFLPSIALTGELLND